MFARAAITDYALPCPPWSSSRDVEAAVCALAAASKKTGMAASSGVLFAIGNPHVHTYWPVVLSVIPQLAPILRDGTEIARVRTLNVLLDIVILSAPEPGFETIDTPSGARDLAHLVGEAIARLTPVLEALAAPAAAASRAAGLARELLDCVAPRPPRP